MRLVSRAWEAAVLPLNYTRADAETPIAEVRIYELVMVHRSWVGS